ncbi:hypothetical protein A9Q98_15835 [Thalassotalea sp. 42_200_T64]|nr:hypothetical protein A9Q98_15835 [Thalassotalea sp. 42_200_T64]
MANQLANTCPCIDNCNACKSASAAVTLIALAELRSPSRCYKSSSHVAFTLKLDDCELLTRSFVKDSRCDLLADNLSAGNKLASLTASPAANCLTRC